jgi:carbonic anhydrase/acetyltransferase-like protein (isoleucine patch superfamily)
MPDPRQLSNAEPLMHLMPGGWFKAANAVVVDHVTVGKGSSIWFGCVLRGDIAPIVIGEYTNIQDLACVHIDPERPNRIGSYVSVAHHALCHGDEVGDFSLIGMHAVLMGGTKIGEGCIIAAGALVPENKVIPPRSVVMGVPGKVVRRVTDEEFENNRWRAMTYFENAQRWYNRNSGVPDQPLGFGPGK